MINGSEEKSLESHEKSGITSGEVTGTADETVAETQDREPPARPVRMRWGKVVEDPPEEPAPPQGPKEPEKPIPPTPKPDPRIEALREKLAREEREAEARLRRERERREIEAQREASESASAEAGKRKTPPARDKAKAATRGKAKKAPVSPSPRRSADSTDRRADLRGGERTAEENARMREELEHEALMKRIRKKRRREFFRDLGAAILGGIRALIRRIRISKRLLIGLLLTILLSGITAVILGNLLKARVGSLGDDAESTDTAETEEETVSPSRGLEVPELNAGIVSLEGATKGSLKSEAQRFANAGVTSVSLILRDADGGLLFSAETDDGLGLGTEGSGLLRIAEILEPFRSREIYVSCILPMRYFTDGDAYSRSVLYAYETALLCEVAEAGADEVVLLDCDGLFDPDGEDGTDPSFSASDAVRELFGIARAINGRSPATAVGIAFTPSFLSTRDSDRHLEGIIGAFDLLLLDLRAAEDTEDLYAEVSKGVSDHLYFILRYSMRVLIPQGSAEAVTRVSVGNWQEGTLREASADEGE
ncbi:MAG: hypothetical protein IKC26_08920 [Clostridia bacterium]|nr:hypothetical protein [Clostridia bacterium]